MPRANESPGERPAELWSPLSRFPGGRWIFSRLLGTMVPYSGTISPRVRRFERGHAIVELRDRRGVRNHLGSVHAIALANLGELATGLSVIGALDARTRGILVGLEVSYLKKARGRLEAEARWEVTEVTEPISSRVEAEIRDEEGDVVAVVRAAWRLAPVPSAGRAA